MPPDRPPEHFDVHASVIYQLGDSLITDSVQALVELVKNSYDADATYCKVTILTGGPAPAGSLDRQSNGWLVIEDNGTGMDYEDIKRGWLTISDSPKRALKRKKETTGKGRTPLGDKGLGRLSAQRLGSLLEMLTRKKGATAQHLDVDWTEFAKYDRLSEVPVRLRDSDEEMPCGTKLTISSLVDIDIWRGEALKELERKLSQLISPYQTVRDFRVYATADGVSLDLAEMSRKLRDTAQLTYSLIFDDETFRIHGKVRLSYFRPQRAADQQEFYDLMEKDRGVAFAQHLQGMPGWKRFSVSRSSSDVWYLEFGSVKTLEDFAEMDRIDGTIANPGRFEGEVDSFNLSPSSETSVFGSVAELRRYVSLLSGIRIYRDGFGIRVNPDWLNLAKQWTGGGSWYGLRPQNTLGYIAISARENACLQETTDREGFKETAHYLNFYEILQSFVRFAADAQEFFRRSWSDYRRLIAQSNAHVPPDTTPEAVARDVAASLRRVASYRTTLRSVAERLARTVEGTNRQLAEVDSRGAISSPDVKASVEQLRDSISEASTAVREVETCLEELRGIEKKAEVVVEQIAMLRTQIDQVFEIIGLGMTAEALTHELENISTQLSRRTQEMGRYARSQVRDSKVLSYLEHVKSAVAEFRRQLTFLAPSLRFVREQRDDVDVWQFAKDIHQYYTQRFHDSAIAILPRDTSRSPFHVTINRGKLVQVFDNLLLNSEYWLKEDLRAHRIPRGQISIELNKPSVVVSDNGRGVDPIIEASVFEPFVSAKGKGKGRGLGLYIVQQLLEAESCHIALAPDRNAWDRLYKFEIDLSGVLRD